MKTFMEKMKLPHFEEDDIRQMSPLVLAYLGDVVYEWHIRAYVIQKKRGNVHALHKRSVDYVKASGQAWAVHEMEGFFSEEEKNIIRRGRNQKPLTVPKNAKLSDYRYATGLEALLGFLAMREKTDRIEAIMAEVIKVVEQKKI